MFDFLKRKAPQEVPKKPETAIKRPEVFSEEAKKLKEERMTLFAKKMENPKDFSEEDSRRIGNIDMMLDEMKRKYGWIPEKRGVGDERRASNEQDARMAKAFRDKNNKEYRWDDPSARNGTDARDLRK